MKTYTKTHANPEALKNHKKALIKRGADVTTKGNTLDYSFPKDNKDTKTYKIGSKVEFITIERSNGIQKGKVVGIGDPPDDLPEISKQIYYLIRNRKSVWNIPVSNIYKINEVPSDIIEYYK